ncbi:phospho-sugar mutase [Lacticaseibacillus jixiensis]|uniref:phospho-sugar mutase n=1 Tax=Lacticaseibacillus jixiensis TaxID=3231926 RepID=UPI0036F2CD2F
MNEKARYQRWVAEATEDPDVTAELKAMAGDEALIQDAFYRDLAFGTGGLRGTIGAGTNRMNIYTVAKASQGLANYVIANFPQGQRRIAISRDSRHKSELFAQVAAGVFAANGIQVEIYREIMPTPCLSFATRELHCAAGIMITASHNPAKYNGYKVYGADGCQITTEAAAVILAAIEAIDPFEDVKQVAFSDAVASGQVAFITDDVYDRFVAAVHGESLVADDDHIDRDVAIVYSPLNGTGLKPVTRTLKEAGFTNIFVVPEQAQPDGDFPTCPFPNPEIKEAMALGMQYAAARGADLLLANDPDCDRVGTAVRDSNGEYVLLSGNEMGMLLLDYICTRRLANGTMPQDPELVKTIVTIDMAERIAAHYGVKTVNLLTGFKFIGEEIGRLEAAGRRDSYIFGFEESYGYLSGTYVRDKDGVDAAFLICEMFAYYQTRGITLLEKLNQLYDEYGYCLNTLHSYEFDGAAGSAKMQGIMANLRDSRIESFGGKSVVEAVDYATGVGSLPKVDVLKFKLADHCSVTIRPSGTEPKLKTYLSVSAASRADAQGIEAAMTEELNQYFK